MNLVQSFFLFIFTFLDFCIFYISFYYLVIYLFYAGPMLIAVLITEMDILRKYVYLFIYLFIYLLTPDF